MNTADSLGCLAAAPELGDAAALLRTEADPARVHQRSAEAALRPTADSHLILGAVGQGKGFAMKTLR